VAPVAPDRADVEKDGLVFGSGAGKGRVAPFVPVDGLVCGGTQVGAGGVFQAIFGMVGQSRSQFEPAKNGQLRSFASLRMTPERKHRSSRQGRDAKNAKTATTQKLLNGVAGAEVARVERFAARESFVLAMVKADAVLAELPAEIDILLLMTAGKSSRPTSRSLIRHPVSRMRLSADLSVSASCSCCMRTAASFS